MVHVARVPIPLAQVFEYLRPGDIVTQIFHSAENNVLDERGNVRTEVREANGKGIVFDIGAARRNFGISVSLATGDTWTPVASGTRLHSNPTAAT